MKTKLKDFLPPVLYRAFKASAKIEEKTQVFFLTFTEAQKACSGFGYEDDILVQTVFEKTIAIKDRLMNGDLPLPDHLTQSLLAVLLAWQHGGMKDKISIIDFGGACGAHYFQIRPFLPRDVHIEWVVVETPAMVSSARSIETNELQFAASLKEAREKLKSVDLLYSSGTIQYVPAPDVTLREFMACEPASIFMNRLALSSSTALITTQETMLSANGPGPLPVGIKDKLCRYPITYFPRQQLEEILAQSFQLKLRFTETKASISGREITVNSGLFAERT